MKLARGAGRQYHLVKMVQAKSGRVDCDGAGYMRDEPRARQTIEDQCRYAATVASTVAKPLDGA